MSFYCICRQQRQPGLQPVNPGTPQQRPLSDASSGTSELARSKDFQGELGSSESLKMLTPEEDDDIDEGVIEPHPNSHQH